MSEVADDVTCVIGVKATLWEAANPRKEPQLDCVGEASSAAIEPGAIEKLSRFMRQNVSSDAIPSRKTYIQSVVDRIEVGDELPVGETSSAKAGLTVPEALRRRVGAPAELRVLSVTTGSA